MITKEKKKQIIKDLLEQIKKAKAIYFANFLGLKVSEINELRQEFKKNNGAVKVIKKNLAKVAFSQTGHKDKIFIEKDGSLMLSFAFEDPIRVAEILWKFSQKNDKLKILGGIAEDLFFDSEKIVELAKISSKDTLLGRLVGSTASPMQRLLYVLEGNIQKLIVALKSIKTIR